MVENQPALIVAGRKDLLNVGAMITGGGDGQGCNSRIGVAAFIGLQGTRSQRVQVAASARCGHVKLYLAGTVSRDCATRQGHLRVARVGRECSAAGGAGVGTRTGDHQAAGQVVDERRSQGGNRAIGVV